MLVILGPTASGKTQLAVETARALINRGQPTEIISADSRQVYRGMDIGTGKDLTEYTAGGPPVTHHLIDIVDAGEEYNVYRYQQDFDRAVQLVQSRGALPILCGGSGLYIEAALRPTAMLAVPPNEPLRVQLNTLTDNELFHQLTQLPPSAIPTDTSTRKRLVRAIEVATYLANHPDATPRPRPALPAYRAVGLNPPAPIRRERISTRLNARLNQGLIEEAARLLDSGISPEKLIQYGLEYRYVTEYLLGRLTNSQLGQQLETAIHQFAKRQMTYFRKMERDGLAINWQTGPIPLLGVLLVNGRN